MNHKSALLSALIAGLLPVAAVAQAAPAAPAGPAPAAGPAATAAAPAPVAPTAYPAKIALINFIEAVQATNEGQRAAQGVMDKYKPQKEKLDALAAEIDSLKKQLQAAPSTMSDQDRNERLKTIDTKDKQYQRDAEDAQSAYNNDIQEALGKVAQKVNAVLLNYVEKNGYTLLLNVGGQQSEVMWTSMNPNADITQAVVEAYNQSSGVSAPPPSAPAATTHPRPSSTTPHSTTPHTTTPKPSTTK